MSQNLTSKLEAYLLARPNQYLGIRELQEVAGIGGWRTRISELRLIVEARGWKLDNRQRYFRTASGKRYTVSDYALMIPLSQPALWDVPAQQESHP